MPHWLPCRALVKLLASNLVKVRGVKAAQGTSRQTIGAIRWDPCGAIRWAPWYIPTESAERPAVAASLGPKKFQGRAPEFAVPKSADRISINGATQAQLDRELTLAHHVGLDYWAYCFYGTDDPMMGAWRLHQTSAFRNKIRRCLLYPSTDLFCRSVTQNATTTVKYFSQGNYKRVLHERPLVYVLTGPTTNDRTADAIRVFRKAATDIQHTNPYFCIMGERLR